MKLFNKNKNKCQHCFHSIPETKRLVLHPHPKQCTINPFVTTRKTPYNSVYDIITKKVCCKCKEAYMSLESYNLLTKDFIKEPPTIKRDEIAQYCEELECGRIKEE